MNLERHVDEAIARFNVHARTLLERSEDIFGMQRQAVRSPRDPGLIRRLSRALLRSGDVGTVRSLLREADPLAGLAVLTSEPRLMAQLRKTYKSEIRLLLRGLSKSAKSRVELREGLLDLAEALLRSSSEMGAVVLRAYMDQNELPLSRYAGMISASLGVAKSPLQLLGLAKLGVDDHRYADAAIEGLDDGEMDVLMRTVSFIHTSDGALRGDLESTIQGSGLKVMTVDVPGVAPAVATLYFGYEFEGQQISQDEWDEVAYIGYLYFRFSEEGVMYVDVDTESGDSGARPPGSEDVIERLEALESADFSRSSLETFFGEVAELTGELAELLDSVSEDPLDSMWGYGD